MQGYRQAYFECKRGQLDMRTRIRGPKGGLSKPEPIAPKGSSSSQQQSQD